MGRRPNHWLGVLTTRLSKIEVKMTRYSKTPPNVTHRALRSHLRSRFTPDFLGFLTDDQRNFGEEADELCWLGTKAAAFLQGTGWGSSWDRKDLSLEQYYFLFPPPRRESKICAGMAGCVFLLLQTELSLLAHKSAQVLESTWKFSLQNIYLQSVWNQTEPASRWGNYNPWKNFTLRLH